MLEFSVRNFYRVFRVPNLFIYLLKSFAVLKAVANTNINLRITIDLTPTFTSHPIRTAHPAHMNHSKKNCTSTEQKMGMHAFAVDVWITTDVNAKLRARIALPHSFHNYFSVVFNQDRRQLDFIGFPFFRLPFYPVVFVSLRCAQSATAFFPNETKFFVFYPPDANSDKYELAFGINRSASDWRQ